MKKIAHFIDSDDPGGAETIVIDICRKVEKYGYNAEIYHFGNPWIEDKCKEYNIPNVLVPNYSLYKSIFTLPLFYFGFARFLRRQNIKILHSHLFDSIIGACFATFLARIKHVGTLHDIYTIENNRVRIYMLMLATLLGTKLVVVSNQIIEHMNKFGRFSGRNIQVIRNGVDLEKYTGTVDGRLRENLGISKEDIVLICVGRLVKIKAHEVLISAFKLLQDMGRPIKLLLVGEGPEREKYEQMIVGLGIEKNIIMLGHRDDIPDLLSISDCFILTSRSEGLSCSIIEAMATGLAIVATNVGGNKELIKEGENGYLVPVDDSELLAARVQKIVLNKGIKNQFGEMSSEIIRSQYSLDLMIGNYIKLYDEMNSSDS